jgi:hypothetical protein
MLTTRGDLTAVVDGVCDHLNRSAGTPPPSPVAPPDGHGPGTGGTAASRHEQLCRRARERCANGVALALEYRTAAEPLLGVYGRLVSHRIQWGSMDGDAAAAGIRAQLADVRRLLWRLSERYAPANNT